MTRVRNNLMALHEPHKTIYALPYKVGGVCKSSVEKVNNVSYKKLNLHGQTKGVDQKVWGFDGLGLNKIVKVTTSWPFGKSKHGGWYDLESL